jgi:hypothetical protein
MLQVVGFGTKIIIVRVRKMTAIRIVIQYEYNIDGSQVSLLYGASILIRM